MSDNSLQHPTSKHPTPNKDNNGNSKFDLLDRTTNLGKIAIDICNSLGFNTVNKVITDQFIRSAGSVGANYSEANETDSRKDFIYKIVLCRKEAKESIYWLKLIEYNNPHTSKECKKFFSEAKQLILIFNKSIKTAKKNGL